VSSERPFALVVGALGGCGATTLAGGLALAWTRADRPTALLELDLECGDLAGSLGAPPERGLDDLRPVAEELTPEHLRVAAYPHPAGVSVLLAPGVPGAESGWEEPALRRLAGCAARGGACVADGGTGLRPGARAAAGAATAVLVVAPASPAGARRARAVVGALAVGPAPRLVVAAPRAPGDEELSSRALGLATGMEVAGRLPRSDGEAADLLAGRWPARRRRLARVVEALAVEVG
jgi:pilus assembly protein CpaE